MKTRPIIFSGDMVNAILAGNKTQSRRVIKPQFSKDTVCINADNPSEETVEALYELAILAYKMEAPKKCPYGIPGDRLWVREKFIISETRPILNSENLTAVDIIYKADHSKLSVDIDKDVLQKTKAGKGICASPSIHMPRWASRITLAITDIRVERLQDISSNDIVDEGIPMFIDFPTAKGKPNSVVDKLVAEAHREKFIILWDSLNGKKYPWKSNPWLWVIEFEIHD